jgi:hypothetical protein
MELRIMKNFQKILSIYMNHFQKEKYYETIELQGKTPEEYTQELLSDLVSFFSRTWNLLAAVVAARACSMWAALAPGRGWVAASVAGWAITGMATVVLSFASASNLELRKFET